MTTVLDQRAEIMQLQQRLADADDVIARQRLEFGLADGTAPLLRRTALTDADKASARFKVRTG